MENLIYSFKCLLLQRLQLLLSKCKQIQKSVFSGCKNRICHHKFKLSAGNNGWMKKETKISIRISVISQILHWLDINRQSSPWDIYYVSSIYVHRSETWEAYKDFESAGQNGGIILVACLHCVGFIPQNNFQAVRHLGLFFVNQDFRSSTCPLTDLFWLLSHVIYLKLTRVL